MGRSRYVGEPTIGKSVPQVPPRRTTGDAERGPGKQPQIDPKVDRSVAQPLPGKEVKEVKERSEASIEDKAEALTEHSKTGKSYSADQLMAEAGVGDADGSAEAAPVDIDPPATNPSSLVDTPENPAIEKHDLEVSGEASVEDLTDEELDGMDPTT